MAHVGHGAVKTLMKLFVKVMNTTLLIVLFFILQYIMDLEFQCPCQPGWHLYDVLYFTAPPVILTWVFVYMESYNQRRLWKKKTCCKEITCGENSDLTCCQTSCQTSCLTLLSCLCRVLLRFISVLLIWITALLFDGHWYFCYKTQFNSHHIGLPCKDQKNLTDEEKVFRNGLKIDSLRWGMILICSSFFIWTVATFLWMCWNRHGQSEKDVCCPPYYKVIYENLLEEKVSEHLKEELTKLAEERAKALCQPHLQIIKEQVSGNTTEDSDAWHHISSSCFQMQKPLTPASRNGYLPLDGNTTV